MRNNKGSAVRHYNSPVSKKRPITGNTKVDWVFASSVFSAFNTFRDRDSKAHGDSNAQWAIDRWEKNVDAVRDDLPASQTSKLDDIERQIKETKLSDQEITDKINDTELSKAVDSILN
ncbi:hypothetical protein O3P69_007886 [Scylla paramamosain]|uniref:Uncharacterized protein n=1 Tax=Scylla paramamosain TaxID=85552 RepID=A0AAW0SH30_SCYPA